MSKRVNFIATDDMWEALRREAEQRGVQESVVIREAIARGLAELGYTVTTRSQHWGGVRPNSGRKRENE